MRKLIGLSIIVFFAILATVPGWSIIGFSQSLAKNEAVATYIFYFLATVVVALLVMVAYKFLLSDQGE
ncbi:MAG: hypothetical protein ACQEP3_01360 [Patescibacteria group bacterium]